MSILPLPWPQLSAFVAATLVFALSPGPAVLCIVVTGAAQGRAAALVATAGVMAGNFCSAMLVALGVAALLTLSPMVFLFLRFAGAAYLIYLGLREWRAPAVAQEAQTPDPTALRRTFRDAFALAFFSPITALFFLSFLTQFLPGPHTSLPHLLALALLFTLVMAATDTLYALVSGSLQPWMLRQHLAAKSLTHLAALTYIGFGLYSALAGFFPAAR